MTKYPLFPVVTAFAAGIWLTKLAVFRWEEALWAFLLFTLLASLAAWKAPRLTLACALLAVLAGGLLNVAFRGHRKAPVLDAGSNELVMLDGCVVSPALFSGGRDRFILELAPRARAQVSLTIREGDVPPELRYGQRIEIEARARTPANYRNPGEFDYRAFLARQDIYWTASMPAGSVPRILPGTCGWRAIAWIDSIREAVLHRLDTLYAQDPLAHGMLEAILLGERRKLDTEWQEDFRKAGTYHVLVVAGLHLAAFTAFAFLLLRLCFLSEISALAISCAAAWLYVFLTGGSTPVLRAASGFTLYFVARFFSRRGRLLNLLAGIALVFLLVTPDQLFDSGFELSFLSVLAIAVLAAPLLEATSGPFRHGLRKISHRARDLRLEPRIARFRLELRLVAETLSLYLKLPAEAWEKTLAVLGRLAMGAWELAVVSAAIQVGIALPMAFYFHRVSLSGISANVLVVPLMSVVIPTGWLAVVTAWHPLVKLAGALVTVAARISLWHALFGPDWRTPDPPLWLSLAFVAALSGLAVLMGLRNSPRLRIARAGVLALTAVLFGLLIWQPFAPQVDAGSLEVTAIDVGQGDSLLVVFPDRRLMLIDAGGIPAFHGMPKPRLDIGEEVVAPYLWSRSIRRIDILALTHAHADHAGGMPAIIEDFRPRELWTGANSENPAWEAVRRAAQRHGVKIESLRAGQVRNIAGVRVTVLAPSADYVPGEEPGNNDSLVLRVQYKERSFLLTGDAESPIEDRMLADDLAEKTDVLKVGHHGSRTSSTEAFLDALRPAFSVISDGAGNPYHHPSPEIVRRLEAHHSEVLRTDLAGMIRFRTDGQRIQIETFAGDEQAEAPR